MQSYEPLFLKYRPQSLSDLLGQSSVKETLVNAINNEKIVHAYLLTGPRGSGKTSSARILAKSLNCLNPLDGKSPTTEPCGTCESCESIANSSSIDVTEIDAASHGHVEDARKLIEKVNLASVSGKFRVYIIDEVHMLTNSAFNALLKVIEEPPAKVVFILATTEVDKVPKTISSRCQQLKFKPISPSDCIARMKYVAEQEQINIDDKALAMIADHSDGAMRDTLGLLDQLSVFSSESQSINEEKVLEILGAIAKDELINLSLALLNKDSKTSFEICNTLILKGKDTISICQELANFILGILEAINNDKLSEDFPSLATAISENSIENFEIVQILDSLTELEIKLKQSVQNKNLLRAWLIKIAHRQDILVVKDLLARIEKLESGHRQPASSPAAEQSPSLRGAERRGNPIQTQTNNTPPKILNDVPPPKARQPETSKPSPSAQKADQSFLDYLSPGSKGMYVSSQASFQGITADTALIHIPEKFKFLKSKLESRSEEMISAISKESGQEVKVLKIEIAGSNNSADPAPENNGSSPRPSIEPQLSKSKEEIKAKKMEIVAPKLDTSSQACIDRGVDDLDNQKIMSSVNKTKLDEVAEAAVTVFGGKIL